jgi:hypothetical protein
MAILVLLVEEKSLGYNYSGSAGWREKFVDKVILVLLVEEKSL